MARLSVNNLSTGNINDLSIEVAAGEVLVITGACGCGCAELLGAVSGAVKTVSGSVKLGDNDVTGLAAKKRSIAATARACELSPRMTVRKCIAADAKRLGGDADGRAVKAAEALGITGILDKKLRDISAYQLTLVLAARVIACYAGAYLFEEPFTGLDDELAAKVAAVITGLASDKNAAVIVTCADAARAASMDVRVAVMADGCIVHDGPAGDIYAKPASAEAAKLSMNVFRAKLSPREGRMFAVAGETSLRIPDLTVKKLKSDIYIGRDIFVGIRPGDIGCSEEYVAENFGTAFEVTAEKAVRCCCGTSLTLKADGIQEKLTAVVPADAAVAAGDKLKVAAEPSRLFLFDAATGENILF